MIENEIAIYVKKVLKKLNIEKDVQIKKSNRPELCDYQYDGAFALAKELHNSPLNIGRDIANLLKEETTIFSKVECVAPGFVNFTLNESYINKCLDKMHNEEKFGITMPIKEKIVIDYGGPNVAKPLHVGHLRSAVVGESIKRILKFMNQEVYGDVHLGDYGLQIGQVIYGLQEENIKIEDITLAKLEEIYPRISGLCKENEQVREICEEITKKLQDNDEEYQEYFKVIRKISGDDIKRIYNYLDVHFDCWYGESDSFNFIPALKNDLEQENLVLESNGAKIINVSKEDDKTEIPPLIFEKSNGGYLYSTTDLATIYQRIEEFNPNTIIYVTDSRQSLHFNQVFRVCEKYSKAKHLKLEHLGFGTINGKDGKPFKTRQGKAPKLDNLFDETKEIFVSKKEENQKLNNEDLDKIVNAIIKFADLENNREKDYIFDIEKFSNVIGKTGPYVLYTYLRAKKIVNANKIDIDILNETIYNEQDRNLRIKLLDLENVITQSFNLRLPSIIANYVYEICVLMNAFYENNHINNLEDEIKKSNWVLLLKLATDILEKLLELLVIEIPSEM